MSDYVIMLIVLTIITLLINDTIQLLMTSLTYIQIALMIMLILKNILLMTVRVLMTLLN